VAEQVADAVTIGFVALAFGVIWASSIDTRDREKKDATVKASSTEERERLPLKMNKKPEFKYSFSVA
jgi:hypothetical protein